MEIWVGPATACTSDTSPQRLRRQLVELQAFGINDVLLSLENVIYSCFDLVCNVDLEVKNISSTELEINDTDKKNNGHSQQLLATPSFSFTKWVWCD